MENSLSCFDIKALFMLQFSIERHVTVLREIVGFSGTSYENVLKRLRRDKTKEGTGI